MNSRDQFYGDQLIKPQECTINNQQAKQIATVKWLLQKAYDNDVPEYLKEPFYYDKRQQQQNTMMSGKNCSIHLKHNVVNVLSNAELYCQALANIYLDPNFLNLNHTGIIQTLARKGVMLSDPHLTETVLLQTNPLKLPAHLCVIEAIMILYAKEIATPDRIFAAIRKFSTPQQRFHNDFNSNSVIQQWNVSDYDQLLLLWISEAVSALNKRIKQSQSELNDSSVPESKLFKPPGRELTELCDGVALCALISFYCPQSLPWKKIRVGNPTNTAECIHNLNLFANFCQNCLPYQIFHMLPQDILPHSISYMRPNMMAFLADLFNLLEIRPVNESSSSSSSQTFGEQDALEKAEPAFGRKIGHNILQKRTLTTTQPICAIPNLRNYSNAQNGGFSDSRGSNSSPKFDRKSRNNSVSESQNNAEFFVVHKGRNIPTLSSVNSEINQKEKQLDTVAAGKPSHWNDTRKNQLTGCGRRSRRNSFSEESQLTIENFGGSQENINMLGRNPDKEPAIHVVNVIPDDSSDSTDGGRQYRCQVAAQENRSSAAITSLLCDNATEKSSPLPKTPNMGATNVSNPVTPPVPNATVSGPSLETAVMLESCKLSSQMLNIRLKLEEKRKKIETEKRRMEINLKRQRQKLNNAAFLQAVSKIESKHSITDRDVDSLITDHDSGGDGYAGGGNRSDDENDGDGDSSDSDIGDADHDSIVTCKDISQVEERWLKNDFDEDLNIESPRFEGPISDGENIDIEKCQKSISEMDSSLHAIQSDLQWLSSKEKEMFQTPLTISHDVDVTKAYPVSFALNQDQSPSLQQKLLVNNQHLQNRESFASGLGYNMVEDGGRNAYATLPNKNLADFYPGSPHSPSHHHHSLLENVSAVAKSPLSPRPQLLTTFDSRTAKEYYAYQAQQQQQQQLPQPPEPLLMHSHMSPTYNKYTYHSMNAVDSNSVKHLSPTSGVQSDEKENHQLHNQSEQFYLHKPYETSPFHLQPSHNVNLASITNSTFSNTRKTWDNRESSSPLPTPPPRTFTSRYSSPSIKDPVSLSRAFTENKLKTSASFANTNAGDSSGFSLLKKSYSSHDATELNHSHSNVSETDAAAPSRQSIGSHSIPTPSVDDMEPQCISFIGSQGDDDGPMLNKQLNENVNKLNIVNGNRTYRIPSPTNKTHSRPSGQYPFTMDESKNGRGFYVSFSPDDDEDGENGPRFTERNVIKPPFRAKRLSAAAKNNHLKNGPIKKPEVIKKPETIYNDKSESNELRSTQNLQNDSGFADGKIIENHSDDTVVIKSRKSGSTPNTSVGLVINSDINSNDPALVDEMERKKERILLQSLQRRQQQEELKARKEIELQRRKEQEKQKEDLKAKKKEEEKRRRAIILEKHRLKKMIEEAEREGKPVDKEIMNAMMNLSIKSNNVSGENSPSNAPVPKLRSKKLPFTNRPRPKTIHIDVGSNLKENHTNQHMLSNFSKKGSVVNLAEHHNNNNTNSNYGMSRRDYYRGSQDCLLTGTDASNTAGTSASSIYSDLTDDDRAVSASYQVNGSTCGSIGRRRGSSYKTSRDVSLDRATSRIARPKFSTYYQNYPRKSSSLMNLCGSSCDQDSFTYNSRYMTDTDSVLGRATPPHRTSSPAPNNSSPSGPGSLPPSHHSRRLRYDDTASESGGSEYSGLRLYKQPAVKSNRGIIMNAIEYCVFPGVVNRDAKNRILEEISRSDSTNTKHFLILFRDARYQFRALYSYFPENEEVMKVYGTGPKQVTDKMFDKFFKYNSGGKCFTQVHTKHLTVTIDAFTIHNSLWQGKKVNLPNKRDMTLVI